VWGIQGGCSVGYYRRVKCEVFKEGVVWGIQGG
jgi:hypothetical protein